MLTLEMTQARLLKSQTTAGVQGNTGSIKLDKSVYPVPFGTVSSLASPIVAGTYTGDFAQTGNYRHQ